ncbi:hypothetical protein LguiA_029721 [Lonicera macranthoides]
MSMNSQATKPGNIAEGSSISVPMLPGVVQNQPWLIRPSSGELVELHLATGTVGSLENQLGSCILIRFHAMEIMRHDSGTVEKHLNCQEEERYQVLRFKRMEMSASESGESALSDLLKLNTSGGLSKHRLSWGCNVCLKGFRYYGSNVTYALVDIKCKLNFRLMLKRYALYWNYRASRD